MALEDKNLSITGTNCTFGSAGGTPANLLEGHLVTADLATVVETAGYFNGLATNGRLPDGGVCVLHAAVGIGSTPKLKLYMLTRAGTVVTATLLTTAAG